jgi:hypothetical protein
VTIARVALFVLLSGAATACADQAIAPGTTGALCDGVATHELTLAPFASATLDASV